MDDADPTSGAAVSFALQTNEDHEPDSIEVPPHLASRELRLSCAVGRGLLSRIKSGGRSRPCAGAHAGNSIGSSNPNEPGLHRGQRKLTPAL